MKFAINMPNWPGSPDISLFADLAVAAEAAGWDGFFLWDHVFHLFPVIDPWMALTAMALRTSRIKLGTMVTPLPRRRPIKLARETITLDHLSQGRLILGVGIGEMPWEWDYLGEEPSLKVRGDMLDEGLELLTACWRGGEIHHRGDHYRMAADPNPYGELFFDLPAYQQPRIPVWVAGFWPRKRPFRRAARWDGIVPLKLGLEEPLTPADVQELQAYIQEHRQSDAPFDIAPTVWSPDEPGKAAEQAAEYAAAGATWLIDSLDGERFGWAGGDKPWPLAEMRARIQQGPPRL
jgi:alkanesulfonate monooxygenase SsuD/methylene tetrahydromethanopterin reductase-like flavin-dependent oxidoreductase (luciferase family)